MDESPTVENLCLPTIVQQSIHRTGDLFMIIKYLIINNNFGYFRTLSAVVPE